MRLVHAGRADTTAGSSCIVNVIRRPRRELVDSHFPFLLARLKMSIRTPDIQQLGSPHRYTCQTQRCSFRRRTARGAQTSEWDSPSSRACYIDHHRNSLTACYLLLQQTEVGLDISARGLCRCHGCPAQMYTCRHDLVLLLVRTKAPRNCLGLQEWHDTMSKTRYPVDKPRRRNADAMFPPAGHHSEYPFKSA